MENSDKAFTNWFVLMCAAHATAVIGLATLEQFEKKPKAKQEPARVSIQLVRVVPPPPPKPALPPSIEPISLQAALNPMEPPRPPSTIKNLPEKTTIIEQTVPLVPEVKIPTITSKKPQKPSLEPKINAPKITSLSSPKISKTTAIPEVKVKRPKNLPDVPSLPDPKISVPKLKSPQDQIGTPKLPIVKQSARDSLPTISAKKPISSLPRTDLARVEAPQQKRLETQKSIPELNQKIPQLKVNLADQNIPQVQTNPKLNQDLRDTSKIKIPQNSFSTITAPSTEYPAKLEEIKISELPQSIAKLERDKKPILPDTATQDFTLPKPNIPTKTEVVDLPPEPKTSNDKLPNPQESPLPPGIVAGTPIDGPKAIELNPKKLRNTPPPAPPPPAPPTANLFAGVTKGPPLPDQPSIFDPRNPPPTLTETTNVGIEVQDTLLLRKLKEQESRRRSLERQYNSLLYEQLRGQINAGPQFDKKLSVAIEIQIELDGSVSAYRIKESSGSKQFDLVVMTGMKAIKFPRLPQELGENPPYIVTIRIQP